MSAEPGVERLISDWLVEEAPVRAPDRILETAARTIDNTHQRRFGAAWREPMLISSARLAAAAVVIVAVVIGAALLGRTTASVGAPTTTASPLTAPTPSVSTNPSASNSSAASPIPAIPEGTYAAPPMRVAGIVASMNADTKLTAAQRTDLVDNVLAIKDHTTLTVSIELRNGQWTQHQSVDGVDVIGSRAAYTFLDSNTIVLREDCCGISGFEVTRVNNRFTLKSVTQASNEVDAFVGKLFTSAPYAPVP